MDIGQSSFEQDNVSHGIGGTYDPKPQNAALSGLHSDSGSQQGFGQGQPTTPAQPLQGLGSTGLDQGAHADDSSSAEYNGMSAN